MQEVPVVKDCFKQGTVTSVDATHVHLQSGEAVPYDYLVFAFGGGYQDSGVKGLAGTTTQRRAALKVSLRAYQHSHASLTP